MARKKRTLRDAAIDGAVGLLLGGVVGGVVGFLIFRGGDGVFDAVDGTLVFAASGAVTTALGAALGLSGGHGPYHHGDDWFGGDGGGE